MDEEKTDLSSEEALERWRKDGPGQGFLQGAAVLASLLPGPGQLIEAYISDQLAQSDRDRLDDLANSLVREMTDTRRQLNSDFIRKGDFADLYREIGERVKREPSEERRQFYKNILLGAVFSQDKNPYTEAIKFTRTLENLNPEHIGVLRYLYDSNEAWSTPFFDLMNRNPLINIDILIVRWVKGRSSAAEIIEDLKSERLTNIGTTYFRFFRPSKLWSVEARRSLTPYGEKFIKFVLKD